MNAGSFYVGFVGRLDLPKGLQYLIDALALLAQDNLELVVAGEGPAREQLERHSQSAGIRCRFLGLVALSDIPAMMASMDVMVVPSITTPGWAEQFGRVVVESMFAGTPLIVTNSGSIPEVVGDAAIVVPERAATPLADAIDRVRRNPASSRRLAASAREQALRRFHPDRLAEQFIEFWSQVTLRASP
jgi:glycosyltransferase involved in cell wall biosynthesis